MNTLEGKDGGSAAGHCKWVSPHAPPGNFGDFRCFEVHSSEFCGIATEKQTELLEESLTIIIIIIAC